VKHSPSANLGTNDRPKQFPALAIKAHHLQTADNAALASEVGKVPSSGNPSAHLELRLISHSPQSKRDNDA
jgi:hypothetical protein